MLRRRLEYPELKRGASSARSSKRVSCCIEDKASRTQLIEESVEQGLHAVARYQPPSDNVMRMHAKTAMIENGVVHLGTEAAWKEAGASQPEKSEPLSVMARRLGIPRSL